MVDVGVYVSAASGTGNLPRMLDGRQEQEPGPGLAALDGWDDS